MRENSTGKGTRCFKGQRVCVSVCSGSPNICREEMSCITVMRDKEIWESSKSLKGKVGRNGDDGNRKPIKQGSSEREHKRTEGL